MKKLLFIATLLLSSLAFTACEEEVIAPNTGTSGSGGGGAEQTDPDQWD